MFAVLHTFKNTNIHATTKSTECAYKGVRVWGLPGLEVNARTKFHIKETHLKSPWNKKKPTTLHNDARTYMLQ